MNRPCLGSSDSPMDWESTSDTAKLRSLSRHQNDRVSGRARKELAHRLSDGFRLMHVED